MSHDTEKNRKPVVKADLFREVNRADVALKGGMNRLSLTLTEKICKTRTHKKTDLREQVCFLESFFKHE